MFRKLGLYYLVIGLPFALLLTGATVFSDAIGTTITLNPHPQINYSIFVIILIGGTIIMLNARRLVVEARTLVEYSGAIHAKTDNGTLQDMANGYTGDTACLLQMVAASSGRFISHQEQVAIEHELTNARARLIRRNALPQYLTGLLVGMGLLGTFIGLLATLNDISVLISSFADLDMQNASPLLVFRTMIERMKAPMQSMGIAFSASMFGLLGSIVLGLMMVGLRRLQGDIFSLLSSEIARHIEIALSYESIALQGAEADAGGVAKVLIRIEERYAEAARSQQRALSSVIDDLQKQRADMLAALSGQTEASNNLRTELQQLGSRLGAIFNVMEKGRGEFSAQVSELTVRLAGDARETHKLLAMQMDEQKRLRDALDSYKIEEWMAEAARSQQRALSVLIDDLQEQRGDMLRVVTEQTEASKNFRGEVQRLGGQLGIISNLIEKGKDGISSQISELTIQVAADAKESQLQIDNVSAGFRRELQQMGGQLESSFNVLDKGNHEISAGICELGRQMNADASRAHEKIDEVGSGFRRELQQLGVQIGAGFSGVEKGNGKISAGISELTHQAAAQASRSHEQLDEASAGFRSELQQLCDRLGSGFNSLEKGNDGICAGISQLAVQMAAEAKESNELLERVDAGFHRGFQQLGSQIGTGFNIIEKGADEISAKISELLVHMVSDPMEAHESPDMQEEQQSEPEKYAAGA